MDNTEKHNLVEYLRLVLVDISVMRDYLDDDEDNEIPWDVKDRDNWVAMEVILERNINLLIDEFQIDMDKV